MYYMNNMNNMNDMKIKFNLVKMKHQCVIITFVIKLDEIFRKNRIRRNELSRNNWWLDLCVFFMWIFVKIKNSLSKLWLNQMWEEKRVSWWMAHGCGVQRKSQYGWWSPSRKAKRDCDHDEGDNIEGGTK